MILGILFVSNLGFVEAHNSWQCINKDSGGTLVPYFTYCMSAHKQSIPKEHAPSDNTIYLQVFMHAEFAKVFSIPNTEEGSPLEFLGTNTQFIIC